MTESILGEFSSFGGVAKILKEFLTGWYRNGYPTARKELRQAQKRLACEEYEWIAGIAP
ncbi:hypothetical protein [Chryseobacterium chendengshani]|uniref:hypothetical protein n=1 Tax=Chryseobacterium sp. LJ756 TaxID=2864113 RepID=UPI001C640232|nr:hypothetical protein [Chryseobacterium sp. LJ756]MBW7676106.1 hypothetical protein [Chryseobacterium sp. LJ756]MBW8524289.1 hypothetical protein [Chryseobacterium sp. LJ668]